MEVQLFEGVEPDPSVDTVMKGAAAMTEFWTRLDRINRRRISNRCSESYVGIL